MRGYDPGIDKGYDIRDKETQFAFATWAQGMANKWEQEQVNVPTLVVATACLTLLSRCCVRRPDIVSLGWALYALKGTAEFLSGLAKEQAEGGGN